MRKSIAIFAAVVSFCGALRSAETSLVVKGKEDFSGSIAKVRNIPGGVGFSNGTGYIHLITKKKLAIDPKKKYLLSFEHRLVSGAENSCRFYVAPVCYDSKGRIISCESQNVVLGTDSVLAAPVKKGDKVVKVKDCSKWSLKYGAIAFGTKKDLSDLPNMACFRLTGLKKSENCWEVTLRVPVTRDYPAGTAVRNHRDGAAYRYVAGLIRPGKEWKKISCTIQGILREGLPGFTSSWRVGTAQAGVIIFPGTGKADVEVRNLSVSEVK